MMGDFIWHLRGSVPVREPMSDDEVLDRVERLLGRQRKAANFRGAHDVTFDSPLWENLIGPNWRAMVIYHRGVFRIEQGSEGRCLTYDLRSLHGLVFCLFGAAMFFAVGLKSSSLSDGIRLALAAFGWIYGMNMVLAWLRIPRAIRKAVRG